MTETTRKTQEEELNQAVNLWKNAVKAGKDTEQQKEQVWICFFRLVQGLGYNTGSTLY